MAGIHSDTTVRVWRGRYRWAAFLAALLWVLPVGSAAATAQAQPLVAAAATGSISGTVRGGSTPVAGVEVYVYFGTTFKTATTGTDGGFTIDGLPAGSYFVCTDGNAEFKSACSGQTAGSGQPKQITVTAGTTSTADLDLVRGATIAVTVLDPNNKPVKDATVEVRVSNEETGTSTSYGTTSDTGVALVGPFDPGSTAWIHVTGLDNTGLAPEWYQNSPTGAGAKKVPITKIDTTEVTVQLGKGATVRGVVTGAGGKVPVPLEGAVVTFRGPETTQSATTDARGVYTVTGLLKGSYTVSFQPKAGDNYAPEYYKDKSTPSTATPYQVARGSTQRLDAELGTGSTVSGTVTADGKPVADADVSAWLAGVTDTAPIVTTTKTDAAGMYTLTGLGMGSYVVSAAPAAGSPFVTTFYGGTPTEATATPIAVAAGVAVAKQDIALGKPGSISGVVTDSTGALLAGATVGLRADPYFPYIECQPDSGSTCVTTDASGAYRFDGVAPGDQYVYVKPPETRTDLVGEFYDNVHGAATPTIVMVRFAENSVANVQLDAGGILAGQVLDSSGNPVVGVNVYAFGPSSYPPPTKTDASGNYRFEGLADGQFNVFVEPPPTLAMGTGTATVVLGATQKLDFTLGAAAKLIGRVVDSAGVPIADACVILDSPTVEGDNWCVANTASDGTYETVSQPAGDYALCVTHPSYAGKCLDDAVSAATATLITLKPGTETKKDVTLDKGGSVVVTVLKDKEAVEVGSIAITDSTVTTPNYETILNYGELQPDGTMISPHLAPGDYQAWYYDPNGGETPIGKVAFTVTGTDRTKAEIVLATTAVVPSAPDAPTASAGDGSVTLTWDAPVDGGSPITEYVVEYRSAGGTWVAAPTKPTTPTITVTGLTNGTAYEFRVAAVNAIGQGSSSAAASATPTAPVTTTVPTTVPTTTAPTTTAPTTTAPTTTAPTTTVPTTKAPTTTAATTTVPTTTVPTTTVPTTTAVPTTIPPQVSVLPDTAIPATGGGGVRMLWPALLLILVGAALIVLTRRGHRQNTTV